MGEFRWTVALRVHGLRFSIPKSIPVDQLAWIEVTASPLYGSESAELSGVVLVKRDITEALSGEASRRAALEKLETVTTSVPGLVFHLNRTLESEHRFEFVSAAITAMYCCSVDEVLNDARCFFDRIDEADRVRFEASLEESAANLSSISRRYRVVLDDGSFRWHQIEAQPRRDIDGSVDWFGFVSDVTQQVELEASLERARDDAEEASRIKSDFLANMSHEIRTPMTAILGYAELLVSDEFGSGEVDGIDAAETIQAHARHLLTIINDILDVSKIEAGKLELECIATCPYQIVDDARSLLAGRAPREGDSAQVGRRG